MLVRNKENRNISVSPGHHYTVEKVRAAMEFVNTSGRYTTVADWVNMYNFIKGTNEKVSGCKACAAAKYTASVRNYARLGYLTLLNEGHTPDEFGIGTKKKEEPIENEQERIDLGVGEEVIENVKETLEKEEADKQPKKKKSKKK